MPYKTVDDLRRGRLASDDHAWAGEWVKDASSVRCYPRSLMGLLTYWWHRLRSPHAEGIDA